MSQKTGIQRIVVGVDFSAYSKIVFEQARNLAKKLHCRLEVVHSPQIVLSPDPMIISPFLPDGDDEKYKKRIQKKYFAKGVTYPIKIGRGLPGECLIKESLVPNTLLVVGHRGHSPWSRFWFGSVSEKVALFAKCPVWVHRGNHTFAPKNILVPHDGSTNAQNALEWTKNSFRNVNKNIEVLYVHPEVFPLMDVGTYLTMIKESKETLDKIMSRLKRKNPRRTLKCETGDPALRILKNAKKMDLVVMSPHNHNQWLRHFGAVTTKVVRSCPHPVLIFHKIGEFK